MEALSGAFVLRALTLSLWKRDVSARVDQVIAESLARQRQSNASRPRAAAFAKSNRRGSCAGSVSARMAFRVLCLGRAYRS